MNYRMKYRPVSFCTLPQGVMTTWVELPPNHPNPHVFPEVPTSKWTFGVFTTQRPLTRDELVAFEIEEI